MQKVFSFGLLVLLFCNIISPSFALMAPQMERVDIAAMPSRPVIQNEYPAGEDFIRLKNIIETTFSKSNGQYRYNCISNNTLCPNYKYTSVAEKSLKLIVLKTYSGNEEFYNTFFGNASSYRDISNIKTLKEIISTIPRGSTTSDWKSLGFNHSIAGILLDASFGVDFTENVSSSTMLGAIEQKIKDLKRTKCQKQNSGNDSYTLCPWSGEISNIYLPTPDELYAETIYLNRESVKIENLKDQFEYIIKKSVENPKTTDNSGEIMYQDIFLKDTYTLRYKKDSYTLEEAKAELEKKETATGEYLVMQDNTQGVIPCKQYTGYLIQSQCVAAISGLKQVQTALAAYYVDTATLPESIDVIKKNYIAKFPQAFTDNFSYTLTKNSRGEPDYEIRYIGKIGEGTTETGEATLKKDYITMMSGATVPEIPQIFAHIPADSMVLYVRNPANLIDILNQKSSTSQRLSGIDASESIREFMKTFFELEKFDQIEKNLKHEMAIVVNNLDATAPDIVIVLSEADRAALSPTGKARVVGSKDGFIFIASSKESLESLTNLKVEQSMSKSPDFAFVWWKKSALVRDALMFVGDEFFTKMLTLETYITHYRKYRDYARLTSLQELVWAYSDAFAQVPNTFDAFTTFGLSTLTGETLSEYNIADGLVTHRNIGTLKNIRTLPEARYDLSKISRTELEDYKYNVLQYRDIWRSSLDPMGVVINRFGDGMEVDFFMTPIPSTPDQDITEMQKMFEGTTKDTLAFITNPHIRMGLVSFVLGFDPKKLQTKIQASADIGSGFEEFSKDILDGKNIFDYLGGEFAWSIGSLDPDIFEGWNVEKIDAYISVQVATEAKGKELIEILKKKFIGEVSRGGSSTENSMFSMLAKPLIEDYQGKKIYYVEAIPVPWIGKIGIAYTFVDDFFVLGLNRTTIRHAIDIAASGDSAKKHLVNADAFEKGTFFATLFDGSNASQELKGLYEKNQSTIPQMFDSMFGIESEITPLLAVYYATQDRSRRLGEKRIVFHYEIGAISLSNTNEKMLVKIDSNKLKNLTGSTLEMWESLKKDPSFPSALLSSEGISLDDFLNFSKIDDIISVNLLVQLDAAIGSTESLLRNVTFGMNMGNDEIGFRLRVFRQLDSSTGITSESSNSNNDLLMIGGIIVVLFVLGGIVAFFIRRRNNGVDSLVSVLPSIDLMNSVAPIQDTPVIVSPESSIVESIVIPPVVVESVPLPVSTIAPSVPIESPISSSPVLTETIEVPNTIVTPSESIVSETSPARADTTPETH